MLTQKLEAKALSYIRSLRVGRGVGYKEATSVEGLVSHGVPYWMFCSVFCQEIPFEKNHEKLLELI